MLFDNDSSDEEVRISSSEDEGETTRLEREAEEELVERSGPSAGGSSGSGDGLEKLESQNERIISLLEDIKSEVVDETTSDGGAPADQLL